MKTTGTRSAMTIRAAWHRFASTTAALAACWAAAPAAAAVMYDIQDLGTLGGDLAQAYGINSSGIVTGFSYNGPVASGGPYTAFRFANGQLSAITFGDRNYSAGYAINSAGAISGIGDFLPWYFDGTRHDIDLSTLGDVYGWGLAVNDGGQVAGESQAPGGSEQAGYVTQAFVWSGPQTGTVQGLGKLGGQRAGARGIDRHGTVIGYTQLPTGGPFSFPWSPGHAFAWSPTTGMRDLNGLTQCRTASTLELLSANAINAHGAIAGLAGPKLDATQRRAFLAHGSGCSAANGEIRYQTTDLGTFANGGISYALALNGLDAVAGAAYRDATGAGNFEASLFALDMVQNLNELIGNSIYTGSGGDLWRLREASGINDHGQIVGWGEHLGERRAFLLTPLARIAVQGLDEGPRGRPARLAVDGSAFPSGAKVALRVDQGEPGGQRVAHTTVVSSSNGTFSWGTKVACGHHYVVSAQDLATGVGTHLGEADVSCYPPSN